MARVEIAFAWAGGLVFVASLVYAAYAFQVLWNRTGDRAPSWQAVLLNGALFTLFALHHTLFARGAVKKRLARYVPERLMRSVYVWTASLLLFVVLLGWQPVGGEAYRVSGWTRWVLAVVQLAGIAIVARSVSMIDGLELAGIRQASTGRGGGGLQLRGPYRLVRHPIYLGWILVLFGAATMTGDRLTFGVITTAYLLLAMPWEERSLELAFGEEYVRYRQRVRWRVVPFVY
jgi:protein-S-isoprenylcysteine O-methyltransferase Ste14